MPRSSSDTFRKSLSQRRIPGELRGQHLQGDGPIEPKITREVNGAHATTSELSLDRVPVAKLLPNIW